MIRIGDLSTVTLLAVRQARELPKGAHGGLVFHFLIEPSPSATGAFTLAELRDFTVSGRKFSALSAEALERKPESETILTSAIDFKSNVGPDLKRLIPGTAGKRAVVMSTILSGPKLPVGADCEVTVDVGWGDETEMFGFRFRVPEE
jgi:hypothetical protein